MLLRLAFKNIISKKSSTVIVLFIAFAVMSLIMTNAVFDSTENGLKETFTSSFTGDIVIRPVCEGNISLFGDETPVTGELEKTPLLSHYSLLISLLSESPYVKKSFVSMLTGMSLIEFNGNRLPVNLFGIEGKRYIDFMSSLKVIEGIPFEQGEKGLMLTDKMAKKIGAEVGDTIQFTIADGMSVRIRAVPLCAIYQYPQENATLDRIALIDAQTLRSLLDVSNSVASDNIILSQSTESLLSNDIDDFFGDDFDIDFEESENLFVENENVFSADNEIADSMSWNFIICHTQDGYNTQHVIRNLNRWFKQSEYPVQAVNWRTAAGNTAMYLFILRLILNAGIIIILVAGLIVVNNTLVINILDRTTEIGTMRAIGATKNYIRCECFLETLILAAASGITGCILGCIGCHLFSEAGITFTNSFLVQLFGSGRLVTHVTVANLSKSFLFALFLGCIAWIYPVKIVLGINLVKTMTGAK